MKKIFYIGFVLLLLSCTNQANIDSLSNDLSTELDLRVNIRGNESKGAILNNILPTGSIIGISVFDESNETYAGFNYENFPYKCNGNLLESVNEKIMLNPTEGIVYGYYPYVEDVDIECLPISVATQQDYMWATPITNISYLNSSAALNLNHTMALLKLDIVKGNYVGEGQVTDVHVKGSNIFLYANYNGKTGEIIERARVNQPVSAEGEGFLLSTSSISRNIILIPVLNTADATLSIVIDGMERQVTIPSFQPVGGKSYSYVLTVNDKELVLSNVNVDLWEETNDMYNVSITGNTNNIAINKEVKADGTIVITAMPTIYGEAIEDVSYTGNAQFTFETLSNGSLVMTVSSITSDIALKFNGLTSTAIEYEILSSSTSFRILSDNVDLSKVKAIAVDDINVSVSRSVTVSRTGSHKIKIWIADGVTSVPDYLLKDVPNIVGTCIIPSRICDLIGKEAFSGVGFENIIINGEIKHIDNSAFSKSKNLKAFVCPDSLVEISNKAFWYCSNLQAIEFNDCLKKIGDEAFEYTSIKKYIIPDSVTSIGYSAFAGTKGSEIYFGYGITILDEDYFGTPCDFSIVSFSSNVEEISAYLLYYLNDTCTIICKALKSPIISDSHLANYSRVRSNKLYVPEGATGYEEGDWKDYLGSGLQIIYKQF